MRKSILCIIAIFLLSDTASSQDFNLHKKLGVNEVQSKRYLLWSPMPGSKTFLDRAMEKLESLNFYIEPLICELLQNEYSNVDAFYKKIQTADSYSIISFYTHGSGGKGLTFEYFPETEEGRKARDKRYLELMERYAKEDYERFIKIFTEEIYKELIDKYPERDREPDLKELLSETEMANVISRIINDVGYYWPYAYREYDQIIPFVKELYDQNITLLSEFMKYLIPKLNWENDYFERGSHLEGGGSYVIILKHKFIDKTFAQ